MATAGDMTITLSTGEPLSGVVTGIDWGTNGDTTHHVVDSNGQSLESSLKDISISITIKVSSLYEKLQMGHFGLVSVEVPVETDEERRVKDAQARMAALAFVNRVRREHGLEAIDALVPGYRGMSMGCAIARSIMYDASARIAFVSTSAGGTTVTHHDGRISVYDHESDVSRFVWAFDEQRYDDLTLARPPLESGLGAVNTIDAFKTDFDYKIPIANHFAMYEPKSPPFKILSVVGL